MKKNGFAFIETIVVIVILCTTLLYVYNSYNSVIQDEEERLYYDDTTYIYRTNYIREFLEDNTNLQGLTLSFLDTYIITIGSDYEAMYTGSELNNGIDDSLDKIVANFNVNQMVIVDSNFFNDCFYETDKCSKSYENISYNLKDYVNTLSKTNSDYYLVVEYNNDTYGSSKFYYSSLGINITDKTSSSSLIAKGYVYTGSVQTFTVETSGTYKLEVWGAQGGDELTSSYTSPGGYGGYSVGEVELNAGDTLYIYVGGKGSSVEGGKTGAIAAGGYNGGGNGYSNNSGTSSRNNGGGGATHIATQSGLLSTLESSPESILIVAGGGGGSTYWYSDDASTQQSSGGAGGGFTASDGGTAGHTKGLGATQSSGGGGYATGSFGKGADGNSSSVGGSGGGGGFYGGGSSLDNDGAGGGSGYIASSKLTNKAMYCYKCSASNDSTTKTITTECSNASPKASCSKIGNGYARISYVGGTS